MAYGFEFTDLANPSALGEALPRGGGRIAFPSGEVQTYQFMPPSIEERNAALMEAARRAEEFDRQKREAGEMRSLMDDLIQSGKVDDASKVVEQALKFQAIRKYERDFRQAKAANMDDASATAYSMMRNLPMLTSGAQETVAQSTRQPREFTSRTGDQFAIGPTGTMTRVRDPNESPRPVELGGGRQGAVFGGRLYPFAAPKVDALDQGEVLRALQKERDTAVKARENLGEVGALSFGKNAKRQQIEAADATVQALTDRINGIIQGGGMASPEEADRAEARRQMLEGQVGGGVPQRTQGSSGPIVPLPRNKSELSIGTLYDTPKGVMHWNGDRFIPVQTR